MVEKPESRFKRKLEVELNARKIWYMKVWGNMFQRDGVPDILCCINGRFAGIELKIDTGRLSALQKYNLSEINRNGGIGIWAKDSELKELVAYIDTVLEGHPDLAFQSEHSIIDYEIPTGDM